MRKAGFLSLFPPLSVIPPLKAQSFLILSCPGSNPTKLDHKHLKVSILNKNIDIAKRRRDLINECYLTEQVVP